MGYGVAAMSMYGSLCRRLCRLNQISKAPSVIIEQIAITIPMMDPMGSVFLKEYWMHSEDSDNWYAYLRIELFESFVGVLPMMLVLDIPEDEDMTVWLGEAVVSPGLGMGLELAV